MKVYDVNGQPYEAVPDLTKGWLDIRKRVTKHHPAIPAVQEKSEIRLMEGTTDLYEVAVTVPGHPEIPAWDEYEEYQVYIPYTKAELEERNRPTIEEQVKSLQDAVLDIMNIIGNFMGGTKSV